MQALWPIVKREFAAYFATPIAYVFVVIFAALAGVFTFHIGGFYERGIADLIPFFQYLPWLFLVLAPAISMRLWAEERRAGTIELLMTLPVTVSAAVLGKWLAGWLFMGLALVATMTLWITVNWLGTPDNGVIAVSYLGAWATAGVLLAMGAAVSALTRNQVIAFILAALVIFVFMTAGTPVVLDAVRAVLPAPVSEAVAALSVLTHYVSASRGVLVLSDVIYWLTMTLFWLFANAVIVELKKAD
ncbi:MAG TPA: ABC transporter permease [Thermopetrobacter sp.]|nr:ABC transporter permease [Thermopetrobacter sp.]